MTLFHRCRCVCKLLSALWVTTGVFHLLLLVKELPEAGCLLALGCEFPLTLMVKRQSLWWHPDLAVYAVRELLSPVDLVVV